ncbi:MAG: tetratricopeptide repeat protein [Bacteroidetes bacterium]|nr:tetratricopeptide repeat protein [Bacteroidota bacterium]
MNDITYFDDYYHKRLSPEENSIFEEKLVSDSELKREYDIFLSFVSGINLFEKERLKELFKEKRDESRFKINPYVKAKSFKTFYFAAAASLIILLIPGYFLYQKLNSNQKIYNEYVYQDGGIPVLMGATNNVDFNKGMIEYKDQKFEKAIVYFNQLLSTNPNNDTLNYYAGNSYLYSDNSEAAISSLSKVNSKQSAFYYPAKYNLALAYIKIKETDKAKAILEDLSKSNEHFLCEKAKKLLEEL